MMPCLVSKLGDETVLAVKLPSITLLRTTDNPCVTVQTQLTLSPGLVTTTSSRDKRALSYSRCQSMPTSSQT
jgi:hypothetical protein